MERPIRKNTRLQNYHYNQNGAYFITICTKVRKPMLWDVVGDDAHMVPTAYGKIVQGYIESAPQIEKYALMPDHVHLIVRIKGGADDEVGSIVRSLKTLTTKKVGESIFQRSYYDHVIRNEQDYRDIAQYIENNPRKWQMTHNPK